MLKVTKTKHPSLPQCLRMAGNLRDRYKVFTIIDLNSTAYVSGSVRFGIWFNVDGVFSHHFSDWEELQDKYFELMEEKCQTI